MYVHRNAICVYTGKIDSSIRDKQHKHNFGDYTVKIYVYYENDQTYGYQYHEKDQTSDDYCGKTRTMEEI